MLKKQSLTFAGIGALGAAAVLLAGCGGGSLSKQNLGTYPNTLPYIYGLEPIAYYGVANNIGAQAVYESSGLQAATGGQAYITGNTTFTAVTASGATLPAFADPNTTGALPTVFAPGGQYVDAVNQTGGAIASVTAVPAGTPVFFRAAIANGVANNATPGISGATLTSTDTQLAAVPGLTAGLPLTFATGASVVGGAFSNATYVTGTGGTATPFTIPAATTAGLHTVTATVSDTAGRVTATTFVFPVVTPTTVALFLQSLTVLVPATATAAATTTTTAIAAGDTVAIDGGAGAGTYPTGYAPTTADPQGTVVFFVAPGTHTVTETDAKGNVVQTETFTLPATDAGTTLLTPPTPDGAPVAAAARPLVIHPAAKRAFKRR